MRHLCHRSQGISSYHQHEPEALTLFGRASRIDTMDPGNHSFAVALAAELCHFPLAVVQAGAYLVASQGISLQMYLDMFQQCRRDLLETMPAQTIMSYDKAVYITWELSFAKLSATAAMFLSICSHFHFEGITPAIFQRALVALTHEDSGWQDWVGETFNDDVLYSRADEFFWKLRKSGRQVA